MTDGLLRTMSGAFFLTNDSPEGYNLNKRLHDI